MRDETAPTADLERLVASLPHLLWTCAPSGECDYLSPQWVAFTGRPASAQLGYRWLEQLHPDDVEITRARWARSAASGEPFDTEFRIRRHDGVYRWFKTRALPAFDAEGRLRKWYGTNTDIQALRDAEDEVARANRELEATVLARTADLRAANKRLQTVAVQLENAQRLTHVGSWELDVSTGAVGWSDELFRIFGMTPTAVAPRFEAQEALYEAASWRVLGEAVERATRGGVGYELELVALRVDGERRRVIACGEAIRGPEGTVEQLVGTLQDVTDREAAANEIRVLSERLQLATSAAKIGVWTWDLETQALTWDRTMHALYDVPTDVLLEYRHWRDALHPADAERAEGELLRAVEGGPPFDTTFRIVSRSGVERYVQAAAAFERDASGRPIRMTGVNWDITELRSTELSLRKTEALQRAILEHAGPAIIAKDRDGIITLFNPAAESMLGYRAEELVGRATPAVFHLPAEVEARRAALISSGVKLRSPFDVFVVDAHRTGHDVNEWTYVSKSGEHIPVLLTVTCLRDTSGAIVGYLGVAVNLSERKAQERNLIELNRLLGDRSRQMQVLLQEVHHRVKNNLQIIASMVNMQARQTAEGPSKSALIECRTRVQAIALIHEQLYQSHDYARIPFATYAKELARNIHQASGRTAENVAFAFVLEPIALTVDIAIPCGLILNELVTNAIKHAFPEGRAGNVTIALRREGPNIALAVVDDGVGLVAGFDPGAQRSLGMQLVVDLARQLRGRCEVGERTEAPGAELRVVFPAPSETPDDGYPDRP